MGPTLRCVEIEIEIRWRPEEIEMLQVASSASIGFGVGATRGELSSSSFKEGYWESTSGKGGCAGAQICVESTEVSSWQ